MRARVRSVVGEVLPIRRGVSGGWVEGLGPKVL